MTEDNATSLTLLEKARAGDQAAWRRVVDLYRPLILYWCRRGGAGEDVEDLAQEILLAAAMGIGHFHRDRPGDSFRGWLRGVARNKLLDRSRRRGRRVDEAAGGTIAGQLLGDQPDGLGGPDDDAERDEVRKLYMRALDIVRGEFEDRTWKAFWRVAVENLTPAEVGVDLGVTPAAVRLAKSRILRRLKEVVGDLID